MFFVCYCWSGVVLGSVGSLKVDWSALRSLSSFIMSFLSHSEGVMPSCVAW